MGATIPADVLMFLGELQTTVTALIEKYYTAAKEGGLDKAFQYYAPIGVRVYSDGTYLAQLLEEGVEIYPEDPNG